MGALAPIVTPEVQDGVNRGVLCMVCKKPLARMSQVVGLPHRPQKLCLGCYRTAFAEWNNQLAPQPAPVPALPPASPRIDSPRVRTVQSPLQDSLNPKEQQILRNYNAIVTDSAAADDLPQLPAPTPRRRRRHK